MNKLIELLLREPVITILLLGWVLSAIGGAVNRSRRRQQQAPRLPQPRQQAPGPMAPRAPSSRPTTADDIAAEMRRVLGLEPAAEQRRPRPETARPRNVAEAERPPQPLRPQRLGRIGTRVAPHVGERIERRAGPASGAVGAAALGGLGGRTLRRRRAARRAHSLVDLSDLPRAIVLKEILDRPLGLRDQR